MKIAYVCPYDLSYPGGVQDQAIQQATRASVLGHSVSILAPLSRPEVMEEHQGVSVVYAGKVTPVPMGRATVSRVTLIPNLREIWKFLRNENYDVVHVHAPEALPLGLLSLAFTNTRSTALITTSHANYGKSFFPWTYSTIVKLTQMYRFTNKIDARIAVSEAARDAISQFMPGDYLVIPNGIDTNRFSPEVKPISGYNDGKFNVLFVGRLGNHEKRKGLQYLVSAFGRLHETKPNTRLIVVGPGSPDSDTTNELSRLNQKTLDDIIFVGRVPGSELPGYYAAAHLAVFPATGKESFGLVLCEAMATGKPVIAFDIPGYRNVVLGRNGTHSLTGQSRIFEAEAGFVVRPKDPDSLTECLEVLVSNPEKGKAMGAEGRRIVVENFSSDSVFARTFGIYQGAIAEKRERAPQMHPLKRAYHSISQRLEFLK